MSQKVNLAKKKLLQFWTINKEKKPSSLYPNLICPDMGRSFRSVVRNLIKDEGHIMLLYNQPLERLRRVCKLISELNIGTHVLCVLTKHFRCTCLLNISAHCCVCYYLGVNFKTNLSIFASLFNRAVKIIGSRLLDSLLRRRTQTWAPRNLSQREERTDVLSHRAKGFPKRSVRT